MNQSFQQYFRCPEPYADFALNGVLSLTRGYFRFGPNAICFGNCAGHEPSNTSSGQLVDVAPQMLFKRGTTHLPFDPDDVLDQLRYEKYALSTREKKSMTQSAVGNIYYGIRPLLPVVIRKHLQRMRLNDWEGLSFPRWPVDRSVDEILELMMLCSLRAQGLERIPFIWFWPEGASSAMIMTHDVETARGKDFCRTLMDIDDQFGIKASFQVVPERRYEVTPEYLQSMTDRGFEIGVQDLNHDGLLYKSREEFLARAAKINAYGRAWGSDGFRSAVLYRRQEWFDALDFSYDMSVPNVAHLDPQRGGCCTVMPYFIGKLLELPVTATQDYSLFHILRDHSIDLWKQQIDLIMEKHGLISFIVHPDYIGDRHSRETFETLLGHLRELRGQKNVWISTPREINRWWRQRTTLKLVEEAGEWRIEGDGHERARIAYASERNGQLQFSFEPVTTRVMATTNPSVLKTQNTPIMESSSS